MDLLRYTHQSWDHYVTGAVKFKARARLCYYLSVSRCVALTSRTPVYKDLSDEG